MWSERRRQFSALGLLAPLGATLTGCDRTSGAVGAITALTVGDDRPGSARLLGADSQWYAEQLIEGNARPRLRIAVMPSGFYAPEITRDWRLKPAQRGTLVTQTRAIHVMACGYEVSGEEAFRDAMVRCADFLLKAFRHPSQPGLYAPEVSPEGRVLKDHVHLYGQMQAMFALAHAWRSSAEKRFLDAALNTWLHLDLKGWLAGRAWEGPPVALNVVLHAFEAVLVLARAAPAAFLREDLTMLGEFIRTRFLDERSGRLHERAGADGRPLPDAPIAPGHGFQVAFLWSRAVTAGLPASFLQHAIRMVEFTAERGVDAREGAVPHEIGADGGVRDPARLAWSQAETLRSLAHFIVEHRRSELRPRFDAAMRFARSQFIDPQHRGWYRVAGRPEDGKGADWFVGYHEAMMWTELLRLSGWKFKSAKEMLL